MNEVITSPIVPYIAAVPRAFSIGNGIRVFGIVGGNESQMFNIRLQCEDVLSDAKDIAFDIAVNILDATATINSKRSGNWDDSQHISNVPIRNNQKFELLIKCDTSQYKVFINTRYYSSLPQRIPFDFITHLAIFGDVLIEKICYEEESLAIETPPPSYDEAQARLYASRAYDNDPLLQPTPGRPPYPSDTNPLFRPVVNRNGVDRSETYYNPYQTQTIDVPTMALNAASPNFRPVQKSSTKKIVQGTVVALFIIIFIGLFGWLGSSKSKHK